MLRRPPLNHCTIPPAILCSVCEEWLDRWAWKTLRAPRTPNDCVFGYRIVVVVYIYMLCGEYIGLLGYRKFVYTEREREREREREKAREFGC